MTKILGLEMKGFKSFAKKVEIPFGPAFNVVLGPNGSGKSNITDGICFVLGRLSSKSMRADKITELVYKGGGSKEPAKDASVSIVFDNSEGIFPLAEKAISVGRTVDLKGESAYILNGKRTTRQAIIELLSHAKIDPEGYNIIMQNDIMKFVEMSTEERRRVLEEISGISHYEDRKQKALNELGRVDESLHEADVRLEERKVYLDQLKDDRDQAAKFRDAQKKAEQVKATLLNLEMKLHASNLKAFETKHGKLAEQIEEFKKKSEEGKKEQDSLRKEIVAATKTIEEGGEERQRELFSQRERLNVEIGKQEERSRTCEDEIAKLARRKEGLSQELQATEGRAKRTEESISRLRERYAESEKEVKRAEADMERFRKEHSLDGLGEVEEQLGALDSQLEARREDIAKLREQHNEVLIKKERSQSQLNSLESQLVKVRQVKAEHQAEVQQLGEKRKRLKVMLRDLNTLLTESSALALKHGRLAEELAKKREEVGRQRVLVDAAKDRASANIAVKKVLEQRNSIKGIHGTVSELGQVPSQYGLALEVAAGHRLHNIVVDNDAVAAECIAFLKQSRAGHATFLPLNKIHGPAITPDMRKLSTSKGAIGFAVDLGQYPAQYKKVFQYVFGQTLVVETIDVMRRLGIGTARMVSLEGDLAETSGAMTGGHRMREKGTGFSSLEGGKHLQSLEGDVAELSADVSALETQKEELQQRIDTLRVERATLEGEIAAAEKTLHLEEGDLEADKQQRLLIEADMDQAERAMQALTQKIGAANRELGELRTKREQLKMKMRTLSDPKLAAELNSFLKTRDEQKAKANDLLITLKTEERELADILRPEVEKLRKLFDGSDKDASVYVKEGAKIAEELKANREVLARHEEVLREFYKKNAVQLKLRDDLQKRLEELIQKTAESDALRSEHEQRSNAATLRMAEIQAEMAGIAKESERYKDVQLLPKTSKGALAEELRQFEIMMQGMGSINMKALEMYEAVEREFDELTEKRVILHEEKAKVLQMITDIEGKKKDLFLQTFKVVSDNFRRVFRELAPKGEVWLILENEESPLEGGVEIKARIASLEREKEGEKVRILPIRGLSGGEKTIVALAFIFAIQEFEPASFYILDEVDAALDKHNSEKLGKLLSKYSQNAQYIIVTHNDNVIGEADVLFGVSIDTEGMSKVTSLHV